LQKVFYQKLSVEEFLIKRKMTDSIVGLVIIPIVGAIIVAILPVDESTDKNRVKSVGRIVSMLTLIESMRL
jgi:hypothetical protein